MSLIDSLYYLLQWFFYFSSKCNSGEYEETAM